jgi:hypothetical protein
MAPLELPTLPVVQVPPATAQAAAVAPQEARKPAGMSLPMA